MDPSLKLYPAQHEGVRRFLESPTRGLVLAYGTSVGKTLTAIRCLIDYWKARRGKPRAPRFLEVCPSIVRRHSQRGFLKWGGLEAHPIEMGRRRMSGTKAALAARGLAYAAEIQIVLHDLAHAETPRTKTS